MEQFKATVPQIPIEKCQTKKTKSRLHTVGGSEMLKFIAFMPEFIANKFTDFDKSSCYNLLNHGNFVEEVVSKHYENNLNRKVEAFGSLIGYYDIQMYSPDGISYTNGKWILQEYKAPTMRDLYKNKDIFKKEYLMQIFTGLLTLEKHGVIADSEFFEAVVGYSTVKNLDNSSAVGLSSHMEKHSYYYDNGYGGFAYHIMEFETDEEFNYIYVLDKNNKTCIDLLEIHKGDPTELIKYVLTKDMNVIVHDMNDDSVLHANDKMRAIVVTKISKSNYLLFKNEELLKYKDKFLPILKEYTDIYKIISATLIKILNENENIKYTNKDLKDYFTSKIKIVSSSKHFKSLSGLSKLSVDDFMDCIMCMQISVDLDNLEENIKKIYIQ